MDVPVLQLQEGPAPRMLQGSFELVRLTPREQVQRPTAEAHVESIWCQNAKLVVDLPTPENLKQSVEEARLASKERVHQRTVEQHVGRLALQVERMSARMCVNTSWTFEAHEITSQHRFSCNEQSSRLEQRSAVRRNSRSIETTGPQRTERYGKRMRQRLRWQMQSIKYTVNMNMESASLICTYLRSRTQPE